MASEIESLDPEILSQIMALGGLSDEEARLGAQLTGARELQNAPRAQGQMIGGVYVKANPLQQAIGAMRGIQGRQQEADIGRRLGEISAQRGAARGAMAANVPRGEPDIYSVLSAPDEATSEERAQAVRRALAQRRQVGSAGMLSGDPVLGKVGAGLVGEAQQGGQALGEAGQSRLKMALAAQEAQRKAERDAAEDRYKQAQLGLGQERNQIARIVANKPSGAGFGVGEGDGFSDVALDQAAEMYFRTGTMPALGLGKAGAQLKTKIANRAAELHPEANLAGNKAGYQANAASLRKLQTQSDAINAFERTALANLDQFLQSSKGIVDTGSPLFNAPARKFAERVAGDPRLTQFNVARQVAVQEIGKVLSGAMGNAAISDSARNEVSALLHPDASLAQITKAAEILKRDMANRKASMAAELDDIRMRTSGISGSEPTAHTSSFPRKTVNGKTYEQRADGWYEVQ